MTTGRFTRTHRRSRGADYWRPIIAAFHGVLVATALACVIALTIDTPITLGTAALGFAYLVLVLVAVIAPRRRR